jgi:hypothetical protein
MSRKSAKSAAAVVCMVAGLSLLTGLRAANAADECLTEPKGATAQGQHWYYHLERGTGRRCWYQRGQDDAAATTTAEDQSPATDDDTSSPKDQVAAAKDQAPALPAKPPARQITKKIEPPATRSLADARAELPARVRVDDANAAPPAAVAPAPAPPNAPNASVWPDPQAALAAKPVVDTASSDADTQPDTAASAAPEPSSASVTQPPAPPGDRQLANRHPGSIAKLLLVAFGALALAGLTGSTVYRLASVRRRVRPEDRWRRNIASRNIAVQPAPARRPQRHIPARPEPVADNFIQADVAQEEFEQEEFEQDEFEHADFEPAHFEPERLPREPVRQVRLEPPGEVAARTETRSSDPRQRRQQIEAYLAQLTRQLQADLEATVRAE